MPRKNAGHTGQASRNPAGRGSMYPGEKKAPATYYLVTDTKRNAAGLAERAGRTSSEFMETLVRRYAARLADELVAEDANDKPAEMPGAGA